MVLGGPEGTADQLSIACSAPGRISLQTPPRGYFESSAKKGLPRSARVSQPQRSDSDSSAPFPTLPSSVAPNTEVSFLEPNEYTAARLMHGAIRQHDV